MCIVGKDELLTARDVGWSVGCAVGRFVGLDVGGGVEMDVGCGVAASPQPAPPFHVHPWALLQSFALAISWHVWRRRLIPSATSSSIENRATSPRKLLEVDGVWSAATIMADLPLPAKRPRCTKAKRMVLLHRRRLSIMFKFFHMMVGLLCCLWCLIFEGIECFDTYCIIRVLA